MTAQLIAIPNPLVQPAGSTYNADVTGTGFGRNQRVKLRSDGVIRNTGWRANHAGSLTGSVTIGTSIGNHLIEALDYTSGAVLARVELSVVAKPLPPPAPSLTYSTSIGAGTTIAGKVLWEAKVSLGIATKIEFYIDGVLRWTETNAPYFFNGDPSGLLDTTQLSDGPHGLTVIGYDTTGSHAPAGGGVTIHNVSSPPPPPPPITGPFPGFHVADGQVSPGGTVDVPASVGVIGERFTLVTPGVHWKLATGVIQDWAGQNIPIQAGAFRLAGADITFEGGIGQNSSGAEYVLDGDRSIVLNHESRNHVQEAYVVHGQDCRITGGSIHDCNPDGLVKDSSEQGAGKATRRGLVIKGVHLYRIGMGHGSAEGGQGLWWDSIRGTANLAPPGQSQGWAAEVDSCLIEDCWYNAIMFEIGVGASFHDSVIIRSGLTPSGNGFWGAGVLASGSSDVDVFNNLFYRCQSNFRLVVQNRQDMPRNADGTQRVPDHVQFHDNACLDHTLHAWSFNTDNPAWAAKLADPASGNGAWSNQIHGKLAVQWGGRTYTDLSAINALPGGGGNTVLTDAQRDALLVQHGIAA